MVRVFFVPPPSPVSTTVRTSWRTEYRPVLHAESACHIRLSISPMVVQQNSGFPLPTTTTFHYTSGQESPLESLPESPLESPLESLVWATKLFRVCASKECVSGSRICRILC